MRFIVALLACLMLFTSAGAGALPRADDTCCTDTMTGGFAIDDDGCDKTPADCDKNCAHHGSCHGHQVAATTDADMPVRSIRLGDRPAGTVMARLVPVDLGSSLRPPRA